MERIFRRVPRWVGTVVTVAAILWLTLAPHPVGELEVPLFPGADKVVHAVMFGWLAFILCVDIRKHTRRPVTLRQSALAFTVASLFGITIEFLQRAMELGRGFEALDMCADITGALLATLLYLWLQHLYDRRRRKS